MVGSHSEDSFCMNVTEIVIVVYNAVRSDCRNILVVAD